MAESKGITIKITPVIDEQAVRDMTREMLPIILDEVRVVLVDGVRQHIRRVHRFFGV